MYYLGIDTSCYTTSIALIDQNNKLIHDCRIVLEIKEGAQGIRQSDAFYQHIRNMDDIFERIFVDIDTANLVSIGVSSKPRSVVGSYMPVFNAGLWIANILGHTFKVPTFTLSHQEGHILSGLWSIKNKIKEDLYAYHLSGGTTELLYVKLDKEIIIEEFGGSSDLKVGQFIDRVGVSMGLKFPCGREMDMLSLVPEGITFDIPISVKDTYISFSGPETFVQRMLGKKTYDAGLIAKSVFKCIAKSIEKTIINIKEEKRCKDLLFIGGVASNTIIREYLGNSEPIKEKGFNLYFADKEFSTDNALGPAIFAKNSILLGKPGMY